MSPENHRSVSVIKSAQQSASFVVTLEEIFLKYWVVLAARGLRLQMFTNANASMVTGDKFPNTLSHWFSLFMCRVAVQPGVLATPQGGVIRASPAEAVFL